MTGSSILDIVELLLLGMVLVILPHTLMLIGKLPIKFWESIRYLIIFVPPLQFCAEKLRKVPHFGWYLTSPMVLRAVRNGITPILATEGRMSHRAFLRMFSRFMGDRKTL